MMNSRTGTHGLLTAEQLCSIPDNGERFELIEGELRMMSPAGEQHGRIALKVALLLGNHVLPLGLGAVYAAETGFILARNPDTVRAPDVAFVAQRRRSQIHDQRGFVPFAPDVAVE